MKLKNKVVVITGASTGIGKELAFQFSDKGARVVLAARNEARLKENVEKIKSKGGQALAVVTDVSKRDQVESLVQKAHSTFGAVDLLINNAGVSDAAGSLMDSQESEIRSTMDVNLMGGIYGVWAAVPIMEKQGGGQIVFVSSIIGKVGIPFNSAYCASKFAVQGLVESIRRELAVKNIHVMVVCPPGVDTPFFENNRRGGVKRYHLHPVEKISRRIVRACEKEKREVLLSWDAKVLHAMNVMAPGLLEWAIAKNKGVK